ncbi:MAG: hypothetical protein WAX89_04195 [Alphaproteobacteria bacterium]
MNLKMLGLAVVAALALAGCSHNCQRCSYTDAATAAPVTAPPAGWGKAEVQTAPAAKSAAQGAKPVFSSAFAVREENMALHSLMATRVGSIKWKADGWKGRLELLEQPRVAPRPITTTNVEDLGTGEHFIATTCAMVQRDVEGYTRAPVREVGLPAAACQNSTGQWRIVRPLRT